MNVCAFCDCASLRWAEIDMAMAETISCGPFVSVDPAVEHLDYRRDYRLRFFFLHRRICYRTFWLLSRRLIVEWNASADSMCKSYLSAPFCMCVFSWKCEIDVCRCASFDETASGIWCVVSCNWTLRWWKSGRGPHPRLSLTIRFPNAIRVLKLWIPLRTHEHLLH